MNLESYVSGRWQAGRGAGVALRDASTGDLIAEASSAGIDFREVLTYARSRGGPALRLLTFHERAAMLKALAKRLLDFKAEFYELSYRTGATKDDSWIDIDGGIGTVFAFASKGARELPNSTVYLDGALEPLSKSGAFVGQHVYVSREGAALHINAFNFPVWGMLEKLAPAILAGRAGDREAGDGDGLSHGTRGAPDRGVGVVARRRAAAHLRQCRRPVRSSHVPGFRLVHGLGRHGGGTASPSDGDPPGRAVHRRDGLAQLRAFLPRMPPREAPSSICSSGKSRASSPSRRARNAPRSAGRWSPRPSSTRRSRRFGPRCPRSWWAIRAPRGSAWGLW